MKRFSLLIALLVCLFAVPQAHSVGEGPSECLWGSGNCGGGYSFLTWSITDTNGFDADGTQCWSKSNEGSRECSLSQVGFTGHSASQSYYMRDCFVNIYTTTGAGQDWEAGDQMVIIPVAYKYDGAETFTEIGTNHFVIEFNGDNCVGHTYCTDEVSAGTQVWPIRTQYTALVGDRGAIQMNIDSASADANLAADVQASVTCEIKFLGDTP